MKNTLRLKTRDLRNNPRSHDFNYLKVSSFDRNLHSLTDTVLGKDIYRACEGLLCRNCKLLKPILITALTAVDRNLY